MGPFEGHGSSCLQFTQPPARSPETTNTAAHSPETRHLKLRKAAKRRCESHFQPALTAYSRQVARCVKGYTRLDRVTGRAPWFSSGLTAIDTVKCNCTGPSIAANYHSCGLQSLALAVRGCCKWRRRDKLLDPLRGLPRGVA